MILKSAFDRTPENPPKCLCPAKRELSGCKKISAPGNCLDRNRYLCQMAKIVWILPHTFQKFTEKYQKMSVLQPNHLRYATNTLANFSLIFAPRHSSPILLLILLRARIRFCTLPCNLSNWLHLPVRSLGFEFQ